MKNIFSFFIGKFDIGDYTRYGKEKTDTPINYLKLQVENGLNFYRPEDIIILTNFPFEWMGIKSTVIEIKNNNSAFANKMPSLSYAIGAFKLEDDIFYHDCDAFQLTEFEFPKEVKGIGMVRHSLPRRNKIQGGVMFIKKDSYDIINKLSQEIIDNRVKKEELFFPGFFSRTEYKDRFIFLNYRYNLFRQGEFSKKYPLTELPVFINHFHPEDKSCSDCFIEGKNKYNIKIVNERLLNLMRKYNLYAN